MSTHVGVILCLGVREWPTLFGSVVFNGISSLDGYLMPNHVYTYI